VNYEHSLIFYRTITPLHVGCGQEVGVVDLPVIRERSTGYPYIPGSGIRGSLREWFEKKGKEFKALTKKLFGPDEDEMEEAENQYAGCLAVHDARLLFYPVRSDKEVFLWITSPLVLERYKRDLSYFLSCATANIEGLTDIGEDKYIGPAVLGNANQPFLHLEEFCFTPVANSDDARTNLEALAGNIAGKIQISELDKRVILVSDTAFYHFVNHATMLVQHNTLTSAKTVKGGMLFSVESIPPETILYGMIGATKQRKPENDDGGQNFSEPTATLSFLRSSLSGDPLKKQNYLHLGGKESIGMGVTQMTWVIYSGGMEL